MQAAFKKVATLHAKNAFTFALVSGDLFGEDDEAVKDLLDGKITIPITTYFTIGLNPFPQSVSNKLEKSEELCDNLHYLGKRSTTTTTEGVRIVTLGGQLDDRIIGGTSKEQHLPFHTVDDAKALKGAKSCDILLTATWPSHIRTGSNVPIPEGGEEPKGYDHIAELCAELKPRYHFASTPAFYYEREPFFHQPIEKDPDFRPITRFISLAAHGNTSKQKAISAFNLKMPVDVTAPLPLGATASPFLTSQKINHRKRPSLDAQPYSRFSTDGQSHRPQRRMRRERQPPPGPDTCFFCLSNTNLATHLIASIGEDVYLTVAKGPLTTPDFYASSGLDFPAHILIIPLAHNATLAQIDEEVRSKSYSEMNLYKRALQQMVAARSDDKLGAVTYEISRNNGVHTHWQFLPMPANTITDGLVEAAFKVEAENYKYPTFQSRDPGVGEGEGDFFRVWIWAPATGDGKEVSKCITMPFDENIRFDLQFGRKVLAKLLGLEKRLQWRDCEQSVEEEEKDVAAFKAAFKIFDFSMEEK